MTTRRLSLTLMHGAGTRCRERAQQVDTLFTLQTASR